MNLGLDMVATTQVLDNISLRFKVANVIYIFLPYQLAQPLEKMKIALGMSKWRLLM